ncbi:MAG: tetratricopeptide repeat protein [Acidobacteria bacterium]|uniref:Tetratricopeptide repeat protein n=1 Tax=Candidatus Polarisedimenticola svalbardensis TaxID=2886004 RepID=A0A8J6Y5T8_9BACT|nr:tetratricopeptide repeat protein [Candidatus Polarisedimenticola svalbardensis]
MTDFKHENGLAGLFCLWIVLACFGMGITGEFVWDDHQIVERNPVVRTLNPATHLGSEFFSRWDVEYGYYRPLVTLSLALDHSLSGGSPWLFHLTNLLLHALNGFLLFRLLRRFAAAAPAAMAAALFLVHPVQSEAVLWISGRTDLLATCLLLTAGLLYTGRFAGRPLRYGLFLFAIAGALLAKEMAVTFPAILLGAGLAAGLAAGEGFRQAGTGALRRFLRRGAPALLLLAPYLAARYMVLDRILGGAGESAGVLPNPMVAADAGTRILTAVHIIGRYVRLLFYPDILTIEYNRELVPPVESAASAAFLLPAGLIVVLLITAVWLMRRQPAAAFGAVAASGSYLLVSGLLFPTPSLMAERVLYLPMVGVTAVAGSALVLLAGRIVPGRFRPAATVVLALLVLIPLGIRSLARVPDWKTDTALFEATVRDHPRSFLAWYNLSAERLEEGDAAGALVAVDRCLSFRPHYLPARLTRAAVLSRQGESEQALAILREVEQDHPGHRAVRFRLVPALAARALELRAAGEADGAEELYREIVEAASGALTGDDGRDAPGIKALYLMHRAESLWRLGRIGEADDGYKAAVVQARAEAAADRSIREAVSGVVAVVLAGAGEFLLQNGSPAEAVERFQEAAALSREAGREDAAVALLQRAGSGVRTLAESALTSVRFQDSIPLFDLALTLEPDSPRTLYGRARARLGTGDLDLAEADLLALVAMDSGLNRRQLAAAWVDLARISQARGDLEESRNRQSRAGEIANSSAP